MTGRSTTAIAIGGVLVVIGLVGLFLSLVPTDPRDEDGYFMDTLTAVDRWSRAIITSDIEVMNGAYGAKETDALILSVIDDPVEYRMQGTATGSGALFLGVAPTDAVGEYLEGVARDEIVEIVRHERTGESLDFQFTAHDGTSTPRPPGTETFWAESVEGTGLQTLDWTLEPGDWAAVAMNADASEGLEAKVAFGAAAAADIDSISRTAMTAAAIVLAAGVLVMIYGLIRR